MIWKIAAGMIVVFALRILVRRFRDPGWDDSSWE
jgi:hypothetical protein